MTEPLHSSAPSRTKLLFACLLAGCAGVEPLEPSADELSADTGAASAPQPALLQPLPLDWEESTDLEPQLPTAVPRRAPVKVVARPAIMTDAELGTWATPTLRPLGISLARGGVLTIDAGDGDDVCSVTFDGLDVKVTLNGHSVKY